MDRPSASPDRVAGAFEETGDSPCFSPDGFTAFPFPSPGLGEEGRTESEERAFKDTEIGPIPVEWEVARLGEIASLTMGQSPPSSTYNENGNGLPFLQGKAEFGDIYPAPVKWCSQPQKVAHRGSVLISVRAPVGDVNMARDEYCIGRGLAAISGDKSLDNWFAFYWLIFAKQRLEDIGTGSIFKSITKRVLEKLPIPLPPLPEQRRIAHVLSTIQRAIAAQDALIAAARELKRSLMRYLFTYGPVPLDQAGRVPLKETEIGPVPAHWEVVRLGELIDTHILLARNGFPQGQHNTEGEGVPHLRPFNITNDGFIDLLQIKYIAPLPENDPHWLRPGDVIFNNTNSEELVGKTALFEQEGRFTLSNHMTFLRVLKPEVIDAYWLARLLHHLWYLGLYKLLCRRHVNQASISLERLRSIPIPFSPFPEQREIARILQAVDARIQAEERRKAALQALFKTMLHLLMTGRVRTTEFGGDRDEAG